MPFFPLRSLTQAKPLVDLEPPGQFTSTRPTPPPARAASQLLGDLRRSIEEGRLERREHERVAAKDRAASGDPREARKGIFRAVVVVENQGLRRGPEGSEPEEHDEAEHAEADRHRNAGGQTYNKGGRKGRRRASEQSPKRKIVHVYPHRTCT